MSLIKANAVQVGQSPTATQNFTLAVPSSPDGTIKLARGNAGATTQDVISVDASGNVSFAGTTGLGNISNSTAISTGSTTARSLANRFADVVNVLDFGADPTGVVDSSPAFLAAITLLKGPLGLYDGGTLYVPRGVYKVNQELYIASNPLPSGASYSSGINIWIKGDGPYSTVLDFASAPLGSNGIKFSNGGNCGVSDIAILNAPASGISLGDISGSTFQFTIKNVQCKFCGSHGIDAPKTYLGTIEDCWLEGNQAHGLNLDGFHTSMNISRVSAPGNKGNGYTLNGVIYSSFTACAADSNDFAGYQVSNCHGVTFDGCGCESNKRDGWFLQTSNALAAGIPAESQNIKGVVFNGCVALFNSVSSASTYGNFIRATTQDSRPIEIIVNGGSSSQNVLSNTSFLLFAYSGDISIVKDFVHIGTTSDTISTGIINEFIKQNGSQIYQHNPAITSEISNKSPYTSGNTYYSDFRINGATQGYISYNGSNIVYATTSDYRLKENIETIQSPIDKVNQLNPVEYTWKSNNKKSNGFLAHELKKVIPNAVIGDKDEVNEQGEPVYQCVDYSLIVPTLVAAIKELSAKVEALESK
jgi:hypothetical protein